jgi:tripartite-type tricarboxylate transporter receptor subunit TctC
VRKGSIKIITESANAIQSCTVQFLFDALSSNSPLIRSGKLKALGVTGLRREDALPVVARLADAMKQALSDLALRESLEKSGNEPQSGTHQQFRAWVDKEGARFQALIKAKGIVAESMLSK